MAKDALQRTNTQQQSNIIGTFCVWNILLEDKVMKAEVAFS